MRVVPDDPGRFFASHPALYRMSLAAAGGTAVYAAVRSVREVGPRRVPWMALAILEAAIVAGMVRRAASECRGMTRPATVDGLSAAEVLRRKRAGLTNTVARRSSRGAWAIVRANVLTRFNAIIGTLLVVVLVFGAAAGRAVRSGHRRQQRDRHRAGTARQRTLDALALLERAPVRVRRDGSTSMVSWSLHCGQLGRYRHPGGCRYRRFGC